MIESTALGSLLMGDFSMVKTSGGEGEGDGSLTVQRAMDGCELERRIIYDELDGIDIEVCSMSVLEVPSLPVTRNHLF